MPAKIYYIRKNKTAALPTNVLVLDTETRGEPLGDVELHKMYLGWSWRFTLGPDLEPTRESWREWYDAGELAQYIEGEARPKAPLYIVGSNITFDIYAAGLVAHWHRSGWRCDMLYDKGLTTIILLKRGELRLKILAVQNFLQGGVKSWGKMIGKPKMEVDLENDSQERITEYCRRDAWITGLVFVEYLRFVRDHDMGGFALTASGQSFRCFRHRFMLDKILHYDQRAFNQRVREAYCGGRVESGFIGRAPRRSYTKVDVNSLYPAVMRGNWYPTKLRQWVRDPTIAYTQRVLCNRCCLAQVKLRTPIAAFAVRRDGKLIFPTGEFQTWLATASLQYALAGGYVESIEQLLVFDRARLFDGFVEYFYPLRQEYKQAGNAVYERTVKIMLNSLYGKFGEKRERLLHECEDLDGEFYRRGTIVPTSDILEGGEVFDWRYERESWMDTEYTDATETCAFGRYTLTAGEVEGPNSAPAIAAHVTDYGRMTLWRAIERVGHENVWYADTDSLILATEHVPRLGDLLHETRLGALKIEGESDELEIRGAKDYTFGGERVCKGIREDAILNDEGKWEQVMFPGLYGIMRDGLVDGFPIKRVAKELTHEYDKGRILAGGRVVPWEFAY